MGSRVEAALAHREAEEPAEGVHGARHRARGQAFVAQAADEVA